MIFEDIELQMEVKSIVAEWKIEKGIDKKEALQAQYVKFETGQKERRIASEKRKQEAIRATQERFKEQREKKLAKRDY